jgi:ribosomal protein L11 methyltransferase
MSAHSLIEISLSGLDDEATQATIGLFNKWGRGGAIAERTLGKVANSQVKTYLHPEDETRLRHIEIGLELLNQARALSSEGRLPEPHIRFLAETDWAEAWKSHYHVLHVGDRLVIKPTWRDYVTQPGDLVIALDPGLAFGSGLHPTTRLCLESLEDHLRPGQTVLDVGTGSGILAIAAARLGASRVLALDTDPLAAQVARENLVRNQVQSIAQVEAASVSTISHQKSYDLVVANILAETIVELAPALVSSLSLPGILIVSGIILDHSQAVITSLHEHGLSVLDRRADDEWIALIAHQG